jgi:hypothetical protein
MLESVIHRLFDGKAHTNRYCRGTLRLERLEDRLALSGMSILPPASPAAVISTVPSAGEMNPYGVAIVPADFPSGGELQPGDTLVANFNDANNVQGNGTTIVRIPAGTASTTANAATFFTSKLTGVTTTPVILKSGFVIVGNVPNDPKAPGSVGQGTLQVLDKNGKLVETLTDSSLLKDPWGLAVNDHGKSFQLFVSNVSGTSGPGGTALPNGTVTRIDMKIRNGMPAVEDMVQIASGYATRPDAGAFVVGPGGLAYDAKTETLYVASEAEMVKGVETGTIFAIRDANETFRDRGMGRVVFADAAHLHGPMGLALAPNGDLITANADAVNVDPNQLSELVEFTPRGRFVSQFSVDPNDAGAAFGVALGTIGGKESLAAVNDANSTLDIWTIPMPLAGKDGDDDTSERHSKDRAISAADAVFATFFGQHGH